jgi:hypothetical protein
MTYVLPLTAVGDAVYALLGGDATLVGLTPGGIVSDIVPGDHLYPMLWFELLHTTNYGGLGTKPGQGSMPGLNLRLHVFQSDYGTMRDAQAVAARAIELLFTTPLQVEGYRVCSNFPLPNVESIPLVDEILAGIVVKELVINLDLIVEEGDSVSFGSWVQGGGWHQ